MFLRVQALSQTSDNKNTRGQLLANFILLLFILFLKMLDFVCVCGGGWVERRPPSINKITLLGSYCGLKKNTTI